MVTGDSNTILPQFTCYSFIRIKNSRFTVSLLPLVRLPPPFPPFCNKFIVNVLQQTPFRCKEGVNARVENAVSSRFVYCTTTTRNIGLIPIATTILSSSKPFTGRRAQIPFNTHTHSTTLLLKSFHIRLGRGVYNTHRSPNNTALCCSLC